MQYVKCRNHYIVNGEILTHFVDCLYKELYVPTMCKGPSTKDVRQMGRGVVLKFRTFPDGGRGVVCESSDVRKFLKKSKFLNFSELFKFKVKTRNYNRSRFQYESIHI